MKPDDERVAGCREAVDAASSYDDSPIEDLRGGAGAGSAETQWMPGSTRTKRCSCTTATLIPSTLETAVSVMAPTFPLASQILWPLAATSDENGGGPAELVPHIPEILLSAAEVTHLDLVETDGL